MTIVKCASCSCKFCIDDGLVYGESLDVLTSCIDCGWTASLFTFDIVSGKKIEWPNDEV